MSKPVVIEVNNKCPCHWNAGTTAVLTSQHPEGNAAYMAHAFNCKVLDDRGLYLYADSRPMGYRFWCTHCKNNDPMSFTYMTDQQTEFMASVQRRFNIVDEQKKKLERRISELQEQLEQEREHFEKTLAEQKQDAESKLSTALSEANARDVYFRGKEAQWTKEENERNEYNTRKKNGMELLAQIAKFDIDSCSRDNVGEESRDFMRATEEMTKLVAALVNVQKNIEKCTKQEARLPLNPLPEVERKNAMLLKMLIDVFGSEPSGSNCVPLLDPTGVTWTLEDLAAEAGIHTAVLEVSSDTASRTSSSPASPSKAQAAAAAAVDLQKKKEEKMTTPVVHIPFDLLAVNAATQNIRRLPKPNYRLCPNHDVCSADAGCTYFHLKVHKIRLPRSGEIHVPLCFVLNKSELPGGGIEGIGIGGMGGGGGGGGPRGAAGGASASSSPAGAKGGSLVPEGCLEPNCHCRSRVHLHATAAKLTFPTWRERDEIWKMSVAVTESDHMSHNLDDLKKEKNRFERFLSRHPNVLGPPKEGGRRARKPEAGGDNDEEEEDDYDDDDDEDTSYYPDGTIRGLEETTFKCFAKARANMMEEYLRLRSMYSLLCTFDFHFLQLAEYADSCRRAFKVPRDLDKLLRNVTETSLAYGELMAKPKPSLGVEGKAFAVGVALVVRETESTFEELQLLRDRVDAYHKNIERSIKGHMLEREIETVERQIDLKQREMVRAKKKMELLDADLEVLADAEDMQEVQEKKQERNKTLSLQQQIHKDLQILQEQHHVKFVFLAELKKDLLPDLDLRDSEQKRWSDLLGEGNEALHNSKNLTDFVRNKRGVVAGGALGSPQHSLSF